MSCSQAIKYVTLYFLVTVHFLGFNRKNAKIDSSQGIKHIKKIKKTFQTGYPKTQLKIML